MSNVGYATLTIIPSAKGFQSALGREVNPALAAAGRTSGEKSARSFGGAFLPAMRGMIGPAVGLAAGMALGNGIKNGLETAAFMEQAKISFETLLGSSGEARKMLSDLSAFAAKTPFELPGITNNARALIGAGAAAESVIPTMAALGDANAALGGSQNELNSIVRAWTQMMGKGKVSAEEMLQITEAGIPIWSLLSRAMGKPIGDLQKMASEGELLSKDVLPLLEKQMGKEYGGAMAKQAQTLSGVWSTVEDTLNMAMAEGLQPLVPLLTNILPPAANALAGAIGFVSNAISGLASLVIGGDFTGALTQAFGWHEDNAAVDWILDLREQVVGFFNSLRSSGAGASSAFSTILAALQPIGNVLMTNVLPAIGQLASSVATGIQPVLQVVGDIVMNHLIPAFQNIAAQAVPIFQGLGTTISVVASQVGPIMQGIANVIRAVWGFIGPFIMSTLQGIMANVVGVFRGIFTVIQGVVNLVSALFRGNWRMAWEALKQIVSGAVQAVWNFVQLWIVGRVVGAARAAMGVLRSVFSGAWNAIVGLVRGAVNGVTGAVNGAMGAVRGVVSGGLNAVRSFFAGAWNAVVGVVRGAMGNLRGAVSSGISGVVGFLSGLAGRVLGAVGNLGGTLVGVGRDLIAGLANGVRGAAGMIFDAVRSAVGNVVDFAKRILGINSPSRVFMEIGNWTAEGMAIGILKGRRYIDRAQAALIPETPVIPAPQVAAGGIQGVLSATAARGTAQPTIHQENHFNTPMSEEAYAELAARKLLRAGVGR